MNWKGVSVFCLPFLTTSKSFVDVSSTLSLSATLCKLSSCRISFASTQEEYDYDADSLQS